MIRVFVLLALAAVSWPASAKDPHGYERLRALIGPSLADGSGIAVGHVEPPSVLIGADPDSPLRSHAPPDLPDFKDIRFHNLAPSTPRGSRHAVSVAKRFYGRRHSMSPGVRDVHLYTADAFLRGLASNARWPQVRVWNHSWVGASGASDKGLLRALDQAVERHDWVVAVGVTNGGANKPLLCSAFNVLSVGLSDGSHGTGAVGTDALYGDQRKRPHLVAPATTTSAATPHVASAAVLLLDTLPASVARSIVVRAALMAGASRRFDRSADPGARAQPNYRAHPSVRTANGLDTRFGAGQLNVYNSYQIVSGRRVGSLEIGADAEPITKSGFDFAEQLSADGSGRARYRIKPLSDQTLTVALIWNAAGGVSRRIADLDLKLVDVTDEPQLKVESAAGNDTGEHLRADLRQGRSYELVVSASAKPDARDTAYALAWRLSGD